MAYQIAPTRPTPAYREGTRRSAREHYKPLEWWRGEKLIYGRTGSGRVLVPSIKEIKRIPKEAPVPLGKRKRGTTRTRSKSRGGYTTNPEEGWDDETEQQCVVLEYPHGSEVKRRAFGFWLLSFELLILWGARRYCVYGSDGARQTRCEQRLVLPEGLW